MVDVSPDNLINLNRLLCYLFSSVSYKYLIEIEFLPNALDFLFNQLLKPTVFSQLMYAISNNICDYTGDVEMVIAKKNLKKKKL
jgi:hypothetical protein